jgi:hypothetical protein
VQDNEDQLENIEDLTGVRSAVSDAAGDFTIIGIPRKATTVIADHASGRSPGVALAAGAEDPPPVTLALRGFGTITGLVTQRGKPLPRAQVTDTVKGAAAHINYSASDDTGAFHLVKVPEGTHVLTAIQTGLGGMPLKSGTTTVQVTAGKNTKVTIDVPVGAVALTVQIRPAAGQRVDFAQTVLFNGSTAAPQNGKDLLAAFVAGGAQGMQFWFGTGKPDPVFAELVPGDYSVCTIPFTGGTMDDPQFMQRVQENMQTLQVYCKPFKLAASPLQQTVAQEVPSMTPFPAPLN